MVLIFIKQNRILVLFIILLAISFTPIYGQDNNTDQRLQQIQDKLNEITEEINGINQEIKQTNTDNTSYFTDIQNKLKNQLDTLESEMDTKLTLLRSDLNKTNSTLKIHEAEQKSYFNLGYNLSQLENLSNLGWTAIFTIIGMVGGHYLTVWNDRSKAKKELKDTKDYLKKDFEFINRIVISTIKNIYDVTSVSTKLDESIKYILNKDVDPNKIIIQYSPRLSFVSWTSIESSGSLRRLDLNELVICKAMHDYIINFNEATDKARNSIFVELDKVIISDKPIKDKENELKSAIITSLNIMLIAYERVYKRMRDLKQIEWLKDLEDIN
ncbi:MAG: hypothetical protein HY222_00675 [Thaumarchaeota archaeon]|nr:hypothetical protein [Nitrososphaerota archaeon]MBI3640899.1 hypothetical protein [Nitrososphaerota archaeon]